MSNSSFSERCRVNEQPHFEVSFLETARFAARFLRVRSKPRARAVAMPKGDVVEPVEAMSWVMNHSGNCQTLIPVCGAEASS